MFLISGFFGLQAGFAATPPATPSQKFKITLGTLEFTAPANVKAFSIHGEAQDLSGSVEMTASSVLNLTVSINPDRLTTKMNLRDKHMKERVFEVGGKLPEIRFLGQGACTGSEILQCPIKGVLKIRDVESESAFTIKIQKNGSTRLISGEALVKLSSFKIPQPTQLGITVADEVAIKFEVKAE